MTYKAKVAKVNYGFTVVYGLLLDEDYGLAVPQICELFSLSKDHASRDIKILLGKDFQFAKWKSELNPKAVNVLTLKDFAKLTVLLAVKHNQLALDFTLAAIEETHERRFDKAFDKKRSEEEYNARFKARVEGKQVRWDFTDSIKAYIQRNNITGMGAKFLYKNATDRLYSNLTGYSSTKKLREKEGIPLSHTPRDYASDRDLKHIAEIEAAAQRYIDLKNMHPIDAIDLVTKQLLLSNIGWNKATRI